jgi:hypothetical protein
MGWTKPEAGVMATRPATAPEIAAEGGGFAVVDPLGDGPGDGGGRGGEVGVDEGGCGERDLAARAEPALNPNQPTQSRQAPMTD